jgi:hypothetical protein
VSPPPPAAPEDVDVPTEAPTPERARSLEAVSTPSRAARTAAPRPAPPRRERISRTRGLPTETLLGLFLLVVGLAIAIVILTGAVKIGIVP